jgi:predicted Zn finger-like uncharacterized protein
MLITTCAHCKARFRVSPQQLNAKQGQVRCGRCARIFSGFEALERFPDDDTGGRLLAAHDAQGRGEEGPPPDVEPLPDDDLPEFESVAEPEAPRGRHRRAEPAPPQPDPEPEPDITLEFEPPAPLSRAWSFGAVFLALVLAVELAYAYRGPIAQRYPVLRAPLESVCARIDCTVAWAREESQLKLEDSELLEVPGKPTEIALGARIRNLASVAQEYPHLELTLTDLTGQAALRRVLRPTDYLGRTLAHHEVIPAGVEVTLQLRLETPRIKATGYELLLFYP